MCVYRGKKRCSLTHEHSEAQFNQSGCCSVPASRELGVRASWKSKQIRGERKKKQILFLKIHRSLT